MTGIVLLEQLKAFTEEATKNLLLPVEQQRGDLEPPPPRVVGVYRMRLPEGKAADKKVPYVLHQLLTRKDTQPSGRQTTALLTVRTIFCVYHQDEQEGGLALLNLMERLRIALLQQSVIGKQFVLDREKGLESLIYPDNIAPYYVGEMMSVWKIPSENQLDAARMVQRLPPMDPKWGMTDKSS